MTAITLQPTASRRTAGSHRSQPVARPPVRPKPAPRQIRKTVVEADRSTDLAPSTRSAPLSHTFHGERGSVCLPPWVIDLESFRRWAVSDEAPDKTPVYFLADEVWIDMSKEQLFSHNQLKLSLILILAPLSKQHAGRYVPDGMLLTNEAAALSGNPDGMFVFNDSFREQRVRLVEGKKSGCVELEGTPDMVVEVVSDSSVQKDTEILRSLYWKAGIPEYWIVDGRGDEVSFTILKHTTRGYSAVRSSSGWLKSAVFGKSFRLTRRLDELGHPDFVLDVK